MPHQLSRPPAQPPATVPIGNERIQRFITENPHLATPYLVLDLDVVRERYRALCAALPDTGVYYAVKANPDTAVVGLLAELGSRFDVASLGEIDLCLGLGIEPSRLSYGNTVKKERDIAVAYDRGVRIFALDAESELEKIAKTVRDATVLVRLESAGGGADWPLSRKFGCTLDEARWLVHRAADRGLTVGIAFHVGSQQRDPHAWETPLANVADLARSLAAEGHTLHTVNLGGGLPSTYYLPTPPIESYGAAIHAAVKHHLGEFPELSIMAEPGRFLVGDAGLIHSEVVLIAEKASDAGRRWVYLDIGIFNGLTETQEEAIRYRIHCPDSRAPLGPAVLAGPTCDSLDVLYEREPYPLPLDLRIGDPVDILATGAYTTSYSTVGFNGFEPLRSYCLPATAEI